jgi:hypothetical protein
VRSKASSSSRLLGDGLRQLRLHSGALMTGHAAAPQLGPQLLDVVVQRNHRPLLLFRRRDVRTMPGWAGSRTPQAPRRGARGSRFCRALMITGARRRALCARRNWGDRASLGRSDPAWYDGESGETDPGNTGTASAEMLIAGSMPVMRISCTGRYHRRAASAFVRLCENRAVDAAFGSPSCFKIRESQGEMPRRIGRRRGVGVSGRAAPTRRCGWRRPRPGARA